jgi:nifR3 family TIM-barrel protein
MAGVTDLAFRQIAIEQGAGFTYTEMVSAKGLEYGSERTASLLSPAENEDIFGVQLFASDPDAIVFSIQQVYKAFPEHLCVIDLNMGCPAPKITGGISGCALMRDLPLAERLIRAAVKASPLPVTVKFRKGWDDASVNAVEFAKMAQDAGASALTVHGRTRVQYYGGKADWDIIAQVKQAIAAGVLRPGDSLPSLRELASQLRVNPLTVARAYRELGQQGILNTEHGRGSTISPAAADLGEQYRREALARAVDHLLEQASHLGASPEEVRAAIEERLQDIRMRKEEETISHG